MAGLDERLAQIMRLDAISLDRGDVLRGHGSAPEPARPGLLTAAKKATRHPGGSLKPVGVLDVVPVADFHHKTIELAPRHSFEGPPVARALFGADEIVLAICTIDLALEERMTELFTEDPVQAMTLDARAWPRSQDLQYCPCSDSRHGESARPGIGHTRAAWAGGLVDSAAAGPLLPAPG